MLPVTVRGVGVERERGGVTAATFTLSEAPTPGWIAFFRERARYSVFNPLATGLLWVEVAVATFEHNRVRIGLPRMEDLEEMIRSVERFIEGANWRNVAKWFCAGRSGRTGELEGPEYGPNRRSSRLGG